MKKLSTTILLGLVILIFSAQGSAESEYSIIKGKGTGATESQAKQNATIDALRQFSDFISVKQTIEDEKYTREVTQIISGAVEEIEIIDSFTNDDKEIEMIVEVKMIKDLSQYIPKINIDKDKASINVNGEFYATESAQWRKNQKDEKIFIEHLLAKVEAIGNKGGFTKVEFEKFPAPESKGQGILQNKFTVDFVASENLKIILDGVRKTLRSVSVPKDVYERIPTREIFQVELCKDAMLFGNRFEEQKKKKKYGNKIPDCEYEIFYLRNQQSIELLQMIEDYVRSEIKSTYVIRRYENNSCKIVPHKSFINKQHSNMKRIVNEREPKFCFTPGSVKDMQTKALGDESPYWPQLTYPKKLYAESFANNLTFNTCNISYRKNERVFFPVTVYCRQKVSDCAIPYRNRFEVKANAAFGLNLPQGGELLARKVIVDTMKDSDYGELDKYEAVTNPKCN